MPNMMEIFILNELRKEILFVASCQACQISTHTNGRQHIALLWYATQCNCHYLHCTQWPEKHNCYALFI